MAASVVYMPASVIVAVILETRLKWKNIKTYDNDNKLVTIFLSNHKQMGWDTKRIKVHPLPSIHDIQNKSYQGLIKEGQASSTFLSRFQQRAHLISIEPPSSLQSKATIEERISRDRRFAIPYGKKPYLAWNKA